LILILLQEDRTTAAERAARGVFDALNDRDPDRVRELVTADFVDHGAPPGLVPPGPDGYVAILRFLVDVLQLRYEIHDVVADDDRVAVRATAHGVHNIDCDDARRGGRGAV
jgi:hypothetical protein